LKKEDYADVLFFDEACFGTYTKICYGWFKKGKRTPIKVKIGYKAFYVYGAVSATTGSNFSVSFPSVNTECMNEFLKILSKNYPNQKIAIIMDGAGWHRSKGLKIPKNIDIFLLPPYSPELNPVERFWKYLKKNVLHNRLFETLESLEASLEIFINSLQNSTIAQLCKNNYLDIQQWDLVLVFFL
jgi:transposase